MSDFLVFLGIAFGALGIGIVLGAGLPCMAAPMSVACCDWCGRCIDQPNRAHPGYCSAICKQRDASQSLRRPHSQPRTLRKDDNA